jgi:lipopolysaccharide export system protein LptC
MELPRLNGFTTDSRPYELTARAAAQDITKPEILELKDISAVVELKDGQHVTIKSINGVYDTKGELLKLNDHIVLNSSSVTRGIYRGIRQCGQWPYRFRKVRWK